MGKNRQHSKAARRAANKRRRQQRERKTRLYDRAFDFLMTYVCILMDELLIPYTVKRGTRTTTLLIPELPFAHKRYKHRPPLLTQRQLNILVDPYRETMWDDTHRKQFPAQLIDAASALFSHKRIRIDVFNTVVGGHHSPVQRCWRFTFLAANWEQSVLDPETWEIYTLLKKRWAG